jgi:RNA polymerase sigma-70 factor (ECF subfamily)
VAVLCDEVTCPGDKGEPSAGRPADLSPLVAAAQDGDEEAFRGLYRAVQPGLLRYLRALVGDDAEDVASETWLQIARDMRSFRGKDEFRAWAATVGRHRALDHIRRQRRRPAVSTPIEQLVELPDAGDTAESASESISTDAALAMIRSLPRDQAEAVLLRVVVGLDAETAGKVLGKRAGAVRTASYRGLRRLAERLDQLAAERTQLHSINATHVAVTDTNAATPARTR